MGVVPHAPLVGGTHDRVMADAPLRISIEVDPDPGGLCGRVRAPGSVQEFVGWLGLLGALGNAIDRPSVDDPPAAPG
jgi:hypothetical protein